MLYQYLIFPLFIVLARITDVSLATLRIILISKGFKKIAPFISFFEVLIWILVAKQIITESSSPIALIAYSLGYALGTYVGFMLEAKLSLGNVLVRVITPVDNKHLEQVLRENDYGLTTFDAMGKDGLVKVLFIVTKRTDLKFLVGLIRKNHPNAFYTIENVQHVNAGYFSEFIEEDPISKFSRKFLPGKRK